MPELIQYLKGLLKDRIRYHQDLMLKGKRVQAEIQQTEKSISEYVSVIKKLGGQVDVRQLVSTE